MINKQTTLDLNGPILSFVQQPTSVSICNAGIATFVGIATATFPTQTPSNSATPTGSISYRWYDQNGPLTDGTFQGATITGSGTTTLTIANATSPIANGLRLFVGVDYVPSAYSQPVGSVVTVDTGRSTGNALNDILNSNTATLTVFPILTVAQQPTEQTAAQTRSATFTTLGTLTDTTQGSISYRWQIGCVDVVDGTKIYNASCGNVGNNIIDVTNESTGVKDSINLSSLGRYSNFDPGIVYTLVPKGTFTTTLRSVGAKGGNETRSRNTGGLGGLAQGTFTFIENQVYKLMVGGAGVDDGFSLSQQNPKATASGGGSGTTSVDTGGGGQGGGYTGLFRNSISQSNAIIIGGGGGGANRDPGRGSSGGGASGLNNTNQGSGRAGGPGTQISGGYGGPAGNPGTALKGGDGVQLLYSAGGGGGYFGGGGGGEVGVGGGGSGFINTNLITSGSFIVESQAFPSDFSGGGFGNRKDGRFEIIFGSGSLQVTSFENTVIGSGTTTLTLSSNTIGKQEIRCILTHPTACNSPIFTNTVNFNVVAPRSILNIETFKETGTENAVLESLDLDVVKTKTLDATNTLELTSLYAAEKDINVTMELYGTKGSDNGPNGLYKGGQGGISVISFTMKKNEEYVIARIPQSGTNGGVFLYRKAKLIVAVGAGGNAGTSGFGGAGGGVNYPGVIATGGGAGGSIFSPTKDPTKGIFGSTSTVNAKDVEARGDTIATAPNGGRTITCSKGPYWTQKGFSPCADVGSVQFYRPDGSVIGNTATITRGFKAGYSILTTAGAGTNNGGNGGGGGVGGQGGISGAGGGGGSGYPGTVNLAQSSGVTVSFNSLGGNSGASKVVIYLTPAPVTTGTVFTQLGADDSIFTYVTGLAIFSNTFGTPTPKEVERYYIIKISKNVNADAIKITNIGKYTGTGGVEDPGIKLRAGVNPFKISDGPGNTSTWKITFVRSAPQADFGYTTFVNTFTIEI